MRNQNRTKPLILLSQRIENLPDRNETRDSLDQNLAKLFESLELLPFPVPNVLGESLEEWISMIKPDGVVLSGGNNIGDYPERDQTEKTLLRHARENTLPLLGICRGMQMMLHVAGSNLKLVPGHTKVKHSLQIIKGIYPSEVTSYHDYGIFECPDEYETEALSEDTSIEAIRHKKLPWLGCMWHPEREEPFQNEDICRVINLFK
jgi:N5-(cytidine 5'-diphosphoramidyl)-L-glutamine hydrolase